MRATLSLTVPTLLLALAVRVAPLAAEELQAGRIHRIGFLSPHAPALASLYLETFRHGLREYGYIESVSGVG